MLDRQDIELIAQIVKSSADGIKTELKAYVDESAAQTRAELKAYVDESNAQTRAELKAYVDESAAQTRAELKAYVDRKAEEIVDESTRRCIAYIEARVEPKINLALENLNMHYERMATKEELDKLRERVDLNKSLIDTLGSEYRELKRKVG